MKVYRWEWSDNEGPYRPEQPYSCDIGFAHDNDYHPSIRADCPDIDYEEMEKYVCVCNSLASLRAWFYGFNGILAEHGYKIAEYDVPDDEIIEGESKKQSLMSKHYWNEAFVRHVSLKELRRHEINLEEWAKLNS